MLIEVLGLLSLGFLVGLSGAIIPGPLLAFTVLDTSKKQKITAHIIIFGHVVWELGIILLILVGFGYLLINNKWIVFLIGGVVLAIMGTIMILGKGGEIRMKSSRVDSSFVGGIFYTAFNPSQPAWWATAGLALLITGLEVLGIAGVILVTFGHWLSDFAYYLLVSFIIHRHEEFINPRQRQLTLILGAFLLILGIYFLIVSFDGLG
ncbi:MAG: LysE family transporter [Methanomassiliicoccales archaeon]|nr:LysE family transporter [Methanomassiliicoccales archaeon]